jgi:hypothetical protein
MMADVPVAAREIAVPDDPAAWRALGFAVDADGSIALGGVRIATGAGPLELRAEGLRAERPDGLAIVSTSGRSAAPARRPRHANGALAVDHVVAFTDDLARTLAALEATGMEVRRIREPPEAPMRQAFLRLGELILELVEAGRNGLWGLVVVVPDVDALGELVGAPRDAVQPGRRIATVRREAGLDTALAFMTPR